jgi:hypothetical protein
MDLFTRLAQRALLREETVRPLVSPLFAPGTPGWQGATPALGEIEPNLPRPSRQAPRGRLPHPDAPPPRTPPDDPSTSCEPPPPSRATARPSDPQRAAAGNARMESRRPEPPDQPPTIVPRHPAVRGPASPLPASPLRADPKAFRRPGTPVTAPAGAPAGESLQRTDESPPALPTLNERSSEQPRPAALEPGPARPGKPAQPPRPVRPKQGVLGLAPAPEGPPSRRRDEAAIAPVSRRPPPRAPQVQTPTPLARPPVHVHIGRVEVRAVLAQSPPAAAPQKVRGPVLSLGEYLEGEGKGARKERR